MDLMLSLILIMNISTSLYTIIIVNVAGNWISTGIGAGGEAMSISLSITRHGRYAADLQPGSTLRK